MSKEIIPEELLKLLVCPADKGELKIYKECYLICTICSKKYPIKDGIPIMLPEEAED